MSRIVQIIEEIEEYIEECRFQPLSKNKILVNKDEMFGLLAELKAKTPDEIKKYQKMISNRDAILKDAKDKASAMINEAEAHTSELISEHEIMQKAYAQADQIVMMANSQAQDIIDNATIESNQIKEMTNRYVDEMLENLEIVTSRSIENFNSRYDVMMNSLSENLEIIKNNRKELSGEPEAEELEVDEETKEQGFEDYTVNIDL